MLVLDTDVCVDLLRGTERGQLVLAAVGDEPVAVSAMTLHELAEGARRASHPDRERAAVDRFLSAFDILAVDVPTAWISGSVAGDLARAGAAIGDMDTLIAAAALHAGAPLVTFNTKHFRRVPGLAVLDPRHTA